MLSRHTGCGLLKHRVAAAGSPSTHAALFSRATSVARRHSATGLLGLLRRRPSEPGNGHSPQERSLATAVDDFKFGALPFNNLGSTPLPPFTPPRPYQLKAFDPSSPLRIPEPGLPRPATKTNVFGVPGDLEDMLPVFDACLRVGKMDRAALVLKRINAIGSLPLDVQISLNDQYLRASVEQLSLSPDRKKAEDLHPWYELQIRSKGLPQTPTTIACMLKASLLSERGPRLHRLVQRYMGMAPDEAGLRVLNIADILCDRDLAIITEICPIYNFTQEPDVPAPASDAQDNSAIMDCDSGRQAAHAQTQGPDPELLATPQKGHSLSSLKQNLAVLSTLKEAGTSLLSEDERYEVQLLLERDSITTAIARWREQAQQLKRRGIGTTLSASRGENSISQHMASWLPAMQERLQEEQALIELSEKKVKKSDEDLERCLYGPLLGQADAARLAAVTILTTINLSAMIGMEKGVPVSRLITNIAKVVQEDTELQQKTKAEKARRTRKVKFTGPAAGSDAADQAAATTPSKPDERPVLIADKTVEQSTKEPWSMQIRAHVGAILLKILLETAKINVTRTCAGSEQVVSQSQPAFTHVQQPRKGRRVGVVFFNPELSKKFKQEPVGDFLAKHLPMVVEPKPWLGFAQGGFLESRTPLVRVKSGNLEQKLYTKAAVECGDMEQILNGLDVLGKTAWQVNDEVLSVMMEAWNTGEEIANFPPLNPEIETPAEPDSSTDPLARNAWMRAVKTAENQRTSLHSQRCFINLQLEVARAFRKQPIYFPHNVDYRGRAYPIPTYLNHMGADHARAMLKFASGKRLGTRGLTWLKIHLANVYGLDKSSFAEREAFADDNIDNIIESATNPLKGSRWWLQAGDPWQCLAACFELKAAFELEDPRKYISHLPIHQDGTCNGLQHYAALGGDSWGAKQVNMEPGDRPSDVYSAVAELVEQAIFKDAGEGVAVAKLLVNKITRKVVKQTVMTNVYGVTFAGAKAQVRKQLDALYPDLGKDNGHGTNAVLAIYIAKHIFHALASMFRGAHDIQYWLGSVGGRVCRALTLPQLDQIAEKYATANEAKDTSTTEKEAPKKAKKPGQRNGFSAMAPQFRSTLVWTTPLRMPVVQPYRKSSAKEVRTCLQAVVYSMEDQTDPVNSRKQLQAFPPNFIHSLDASHMMLSALRCAESGLAFAAVHDSFWTHAGDVDKMNEVLRDAFIQIHEEDVIGRLAAEFKARHKGSVYLAHIDPDSPVAKRIKEMRKSRKQTPVEELLMEHRRQTLISTGKLDEARAIVTPASVYEEMSASEVDLAIEEDTKAIGIGEIHEDDLAASALKDSEDLKDSEELAFNDLEELALKDSEDPADSNESPCDKASSPAEPAALAERLLEDRKKGHTFEASLEEKTGSTATKKLPLPLWLPLTIPDIPKKGDFEVRRLRESKYFFS